jgi:catechol 2,3-dioxygenase-like lactoylglutathione lyase family enzyme
VPIDSVLKTLGGSGIEVLEDAKVVSRIGAVGNLRSVYFRDPDGNLIEFVILELRH